MSLKHKFMKAYTGVFSGNDPGFFKCVSAVATVISAPIFATAGLMTQFVNDYDTTRTSETQYSALKAEINRMEGDNAAKNGKYWTYVNLTQQQVSNASLSPQAEKARVEYQQMQSRYVADLNKLRNNILVSQGISETDAVDLLETSEKRLGATMFPGATDWQTKLRYLDECQQPSFAKAAQPGAKQGDLPQAVLQCMTDSTQDVAGAAMFAGFATGIPGSISMLVGMSYLGAAFRRRLRKDEEDAAQKTQENLNAIANGETPTQKIKISIGMNS